MMKIPKPLPRSLVALAATGLLTAGLCLGHLTAVRGQEAPPPPPAPERGPRENGPGPRGERPPPPPRPEDDAALTAPVDPQAAPVAVKTATDALAGFAPGQVWTRTAPRGEVQAQATILFQNKEVARLEFDPATGALLMRGQRHPEPPPAADGAPRAPRGPVAAPSVPPAPTAPVDLDQIKARLPDIIKSLSVGQGAEILGREGFWKVPLIYQSRVVGEVRLSADGTKIIQDFAAARDAAIFAR